MRGSIVAGPSLTLIMTHKTPRIRPAMTAIAAVLALSSTQLLAQTTPDATPPATEAEAATLSGSRRRFGHRDHCSYSPSIIPSLIGQIIVSLIPARQLNGIPEI